jgi:insulysin
MKRFAIASFLLALTLAPLQAQEEQRTYRKLTLDNGLRVVLASDRDVNTSSASMAVGIGANADPKGTRGLAHFLEHMLFLANEKYPELNAYGEFLKSRGGFSNAYTAQDLTNYHFQVNHDGLPEALDRFAQFFVSPTLDYAYAKREMAAVNSEHQKNTMDDTWRLMQLRRMHMREDHPDNGFSTGNAKTLENAKAEELRAFFTDYYKPSNMTFAILSNRGLDELEALVRECLSGIKPGDAKPWSAPSDLMETATGLRVLRVVPIKDMRQLQIFFDVPLQHDHAMSKIGRLVGMSMGDEGKGSLLSYLKGQGLATSLSAGVGGTRYFSNCSITVGLTPKGLEKWRDVLKLCFAYTNLLKESELPMDLWEEGRTLSLLQEKYTSKAEGTTAAIALANTAMSYGLELAEKVNVTFETPDPKAYKALVDSLSPENALVFLVGKGLETNAKEKYYGTDYSYTVETGKAFDELGTAKLPKEVFLPLPNPFVPKDVSLRPEQPVLLQKDASITLYYAQDTEFKRPKVAIHLHILTPEAYATPRAAALTRLYAGMLQEQLNEFSYPAVLAGLTYSLQPTRKGLLLTVAGYSESAFKLLNMVSKAMLGPLDAATFERVRLRNVEAVKNQPLGQAYGYVGELARKISLKRYIRSVQTLPELEKANLADLKAHVKVLLAKTHIEGLCAGNLTGAQAREAVNGVQAALGSAPFDPTTAEKDEILVLGKGEQVVVKRVGATDQSCMRIDYQVGASDVKTRVSAELFGRALGNPFYTEMRTKQKLGYIVFSGSLNRQNVQYLVFLIQSGTNTPEDLLARAEACVATLPELFAKLPAQQFEAIRKSLIQDRLKKIKSIAGKAGRFYTGAFDKEGDFDWIVKEIKAIKALKQEEVATLLQNTVAEKTKVVYLLRAKQLGAFEAPGSAPDLNTFSKGRTYSADKAGR